MPKDDKDEATVDLESVTKAAERLGLKGRERGEYIHKHMTGYGYKSKRSYFREDEKDNRGGGFFSSSRKRDDDDDDDDDY
jgi:hypothetical protein